MKYQKSSIPYLLLLTIILLGTPLLDYEINNGLVLEYKVMPSDIDHIQDSQISSKKDLITQVSILPPKRR